MAVQARATQNSQRFGSIDAVRGAAILFVFLSHFTAGYPWSVGSQEAASYLRTLSMIASPTFVIVSGMVAGFLASTNPGGFTELRVKLFDRGIFLLVVGHLVLTLSLAPSPARFAHAYQTSFITDAIALAIIIGPSTVVFAPASRRLMIAAILFVVDWCLIVYWHPTGASLLAKLYLVGRISAAGQLSGFAVFPALPWFAVYLAGTALGERVGMMYVRGWQREAHHMLARTGGACLLAATVAYAIARWLAGNSAASLEEMNRLTFLSVYGKFPPGIVYLGFFGGAGLIMLAAIFELDRRKQLPILFGQLRKLGRSSLFMFTAQYALYRSVLPHLRLHYTPVWPVIFFASVLLLTVFAGVWDAYSGNQYLTVGMTALWMRFKSTGPKTIGSGLYIPGLSIPRRSIPKTLR
jgi:uncharacterized membrane protein